MTETTSRADTGKHIEAAQNVLGQLQGRYTMDDPAFYALGLAWEAARLAWYVVMRGNDGGKLQDVRAALDEVERQLP